jgi:hypothetical protein
MPDITQIHSLRHNEEDVLETEVDTDPDEHHTGQAPGHCFESGEPGKELSVNNWTNLIK